MDGITSWITYVSGRPDEILATTWDHARIVLVVVLGATLFSVVLGVVVHRHPTARALALAISGIFLTIPSLALFAIFIPLVGIGNTPAMLALFLYAILPILRNTVTGLDSVPAAVVESARGMGMGPVRQLLRIRLPLAWPVVMAGVRVSSLITVGIAAIAVLVGGDGLGEYIQGGLTRLGLPNSLESVWTGTVFTVLLGLLLDLTFAGVQRATTSKGLRA
ncbi:MAG: ABC transporter permease [Micrococcales bacterium]|uniref:ABC transporter permease n=1 Tax=Phycicoccus sp. TaxID=1902410 RepID=UPI00199ADF02|nr:ABC transporter permease [Phycicoccus sp.]MBD3782757.1 ABC transporter permease [Micrococcales bacterium]HMM96445.1 ABC transporter permease [Phycicoccus sp.]